VNRLCPYLKSIYIILAFSLPAISVQAGVILDALPDDVSKTDKYLFFMHGNIVEKKGLPAKSKEYGAYEYESMLNAFSNDGLVVISEVRRKDTDINEFASRVAGQVKTLIDKGVPASNITVSGYSKGGRMTAVVSSLLANKQINYVILAGCRESDISEYNLKLTGRVLSIYDKGDDQFGSCSALFETGGEDLVSHEIVLTLGKGHGAFYSPRKEWVEPMVNWAKQ
jgi:hypothetical protein